MFYITNNKYKNKMIKFFSSHMLSLSDEKIHNFIILYDNISNIKIDKDTLIIELEDSILNTDKLFKCGDNVSIYKDDILFNKTDDVKNIFVYNKDKLNSHRILSITEYVKNFLDLFKKIKTIEDIDDFDINGNLENNKRINISKKYKQAYYILDIWCKYLKIESNIPSLSEIEDEDNVTNKILYTILSESTEDKLYNNKVKIIDKLVEKFKEKDVREDIRLLHDICLKADLSKNFSDIKNKDIRTLAICLFKDDCVFRGLEMCKQYNLMNGKMILFYSFLLGFEFMDRSSYEYFFERN